MSIQMETRGKCRFCFKIEENFVLLSKITVVKSLGRSHKVNCKKFLQYFTQFSFSIFWCNSLFHYSALYQFSNRSCSHIEAKNITAIRNCHITFWVFELYILFFLSIVELKFPEVIFQRRHPFGTHWAPNQPSTSPNFVADRHCFSANGPS